MRWGAESVRGRVVYLFPDAVPQKTKRRWNREKFLSKVGDVLMTVGMIMAVSLTVSVLGTMGLAWMTGEDPNAIWREMYMLVAGR